MNTFIFKLLIFFTGLIIFIVLPLLLIGEYDNIDKSTTENHNIISLQTKSKYDNLDILFIGNSYCYSSINTHIFDSFDMKVFNLGIATAGVQFYELLINDYYNNVNSYPKNVLILVTPMTFSTKSDNFNAYPIHRYLESEKSNFEIAFKYNKMNNIGVMNKKSIEKFFKSILKSKENKVLYSIRENNKGYSPSDKKVDENTILNDKHLYLPLKEEKLSKSKFDQLIEIARQIETKGSKVIFFSLPTNKLIYYFNYDFISEYENEIFNLSKKYKLITINDSLFKTDNYRNIDHMNSSGAEIATMELIKQLK